MNGFPRAGAVALLDRDVHLLLMGINPTLGAAPLQTPTAFLVEDAGRPPPVRLAGRPLHARLLLFLSGDMAARSGARVDRHAVPTGSPGRIVPRADEPSVRAAHQHLLRQLQHLESTGYRYSRVIAPVTNEWRMDNDPPFPAMRRFVATWQRLGLQPALRMATVGDSLERMREEIGDQIPELTGEWTDWWANGVASGPREVAASRRAKRLTVAAMSPVWGPLEDPAGSAAAGDPAATCVLFDEHTWGASDSVGQPHSLETWAQYNEKSRYAYRPMAMAKLLLSQRARTAIYPREEGLYVANTARARGAAGS